MRPWSVKDVVARAEASIRSTIQLAQAHGLDLAVLLMPTAARLYPDDLPSALATACAGRVPLGDAVAASLTGLPVIDPLAEIMRPGAIPSHRFHWVGAAPLHIAETIAETRWGLPRDFVLPFARKPAGAISTA